MATSTPGAARLSAPFLAAPHAGTPASLAWRRRPPAVPGRHRDHRLGAGSHRGQRQPCGAGRAAAGGRGIRGGSAHSLSRHGSPPRLSGPAAPNERSRWSSSSARPDEVVAVYPHRDQIPGHAWLRFFDSASREIAILARSGMFLADVPGILDTASAISSNLIPSVNRNTEKPWSGRTRHSGMADSFR